MARSPSHTPCSPHPPTHSAIVHASPLHPASHTQVFVIGLHDPWPEQSAEEAQAAGRLQRSPRQPAAQAQPPVRVSHSPRPSGAPQSETHARPQQSLAEALATRGPKPARHAHWPAVHTPLPQQSFGQRRVEQSTPSNPGSHTHAPWKHAPRPEQPLAQPSTRKSEGDAEDETAAAECESARRAHAGTRDPNAACTGERESARSSTAFAHLIHIATAAKTTF